MSGETSGLLRLVLVFVEIAMHRRGPETVPESQFLFGLLLVVYFVVSLFATLMAQPFTLAIGIVAFDTVFYLGIVWVLLELYKRSNRFLQTASALLGTGVILTMLQIPIFATADFDNAESTFTSAGAWLFLLSLLWSIDVAGFILSRALQLSYFAGVSIVIMYAFSSFTLGGFLFPVAS